MNYSDFFDADTHHRNEALASLDAARNQISGGTLEPDFAGAMRFLSMAMEYCRLLVAADQKRRRKRSKAAISQPTQQSE